jgi:hypothetical protein
MSRDNDKRHGAGAEAPPDGVLSLEEENTETKEFNLSFPVLTTMVDLPSEGKLYPEGHPMHGRDSLEIRFMTAKEEDILTNQSLIRKGLAIDRVLNNIMVDRTVDLEQLLIGDKNALIVAARITGYGPDYTIKMTCPQCGENSEFMFDLNKGVNNTLDDLPEGVELTDHGSFIFNKIKGLEYPVELRLMTGEDEKKLANAVSVRKKRKLAPAVVTDQMKLVLVSVAGKTDPKLLNEFAENVPPYVSKEIRKLYRDVTPNHDLKQDYTCSECDFEQEVEVPFTAEFFWPK